MMTLPARQKVLVVDDEKINRKILTDLLKGDRDVILAKDGEQALAKAREHKPDLILLDVVMPGKSGYDVLKELRETPETKDIAVIIISALGRMEDEVKGLTMGALDYVAKPFHPTVVKARVRNILNVVNRRKMLESLAHLDGLTEIGNRRSFDETLNREWGEARRRNGQLSLAMIDVDCFKAYNDTHGHAEGDDVLCKLARALAEGLRRPSDFTARYGGEEFAVILPDTTREGAIRVLEDIRQAVETLAIPHDRNPNGDHVTISVGGATLFPSDETDPGDLIRQADSHLYQAKESGRNRVLWAP